MWCCDGHALNFIIRVLSLHIRLLGITWISDPPPSSISTTYAQPPTSPVMVAHLDQKTSATTRRQSLADSSFPQTATATGFTYLSQLHNDKLPVLIKHPNRRIIIAKLSNKLSTHPTRTRRRRNVRRNCNRLKHALLNAAFEFCGTAFGQHHSLDLSPFHLVSRLLFLLLSLPCPPSYDLKFREALTHQPAHVPSPAPAPQPVLA